MTAATLNVKQPQQSPRGNGAAIDRILQRLIGTAIVALVATTILMYMKIAVIETKAESFMTSRDGLELEATLRADSPPAEWRDRVRQIEEGHQMILQELSAIRVTLERLAR